jgi:membrane-associated phospholipid phosphatase
LSAADRSFALFNLLLALAWFPLAESYPPAPWLALAHLIAATLPWMLAARPLSWGVARLRDFYPLIWISAFWTELDIHNALVVTTRNDALIARLDLAVFGTHLDQAWVARMPWLWLSELMQFSYFTYYPLLALVPILIVMAGDRNAISELWARVVLCYLACYAFFLYFPVNGPDGDLSASFPQLTVGFVYRLNNWLRASGDSLGTSFPSSHVAGAVALAWSAWRFLSRRQAIIATVAATLILFATVYTRQHFAIDSLAGLAVAVLLNLAVTIASARKAAVSR